MTQHLENRPHTTVVLAMSADGKIADANRSAARFGSSNDTLHLEKQVAKVDGVLFGTGTLRAYGTTLRVTQAELLHQRQQRGKPQQPLQILCSQSGEFASHYRFFQQPVIRWLLTTRVGAERWHDQPVFERILVAETATGRIDWATALQQLRLTGLEHLAILGGGELVASLLALGFVDEFWLTLCPLLLGGRDAPTPVEGAGFLESAAPRLKLTEVKPLGDEVFLHYCVIQNP